jgi:enoyl-CoA hydratase/carnithine racemase
MQALTLAIEDQVAVVTINRPVQHNAVNYAMWCAIPELCRQLEEDADVRVVVWRGAGDEAFSAGGDIAEFQHYRSNRQQAEQYNDRVQTALDSMLTLSKPSIAAIKGYCVGGGFMLACHCDLRIAADNARFGLPVARLGFLITYEQMQRFVSLIGAAALADLLLTARLVNAREALAIGLCSQVHPLEQLDATVAMLAGTMVQLSPLAQRRHKQMMRTLLHKPDLTTLTAAERDLLDSAFDSLDYAEGVRAFIEKRTPRFPGR